MKILRVGDVHCKPNNLEESHKLLQFVLDQALEHKVDVVEFLGDSFDTHDIVRLRVLKFWQHWLTILSDQPFKTRVLIGNHDVTGDYSDPYSALHPFLDLENNNFKIVHEPFLDGVYGYLPYIHSNDEFIEKANALANQGATVLVSHPNYEGAVYDNDTLINKGVSDDSLDSSFHHLIGGHIHCFSDDTEFLTENGWKIYRDILDSEKLITLNMRDKKLESSPILGRVQRKNEGDLVRLKGKHVDLLVTEDHDVVLKIKSRENEIDFDKRKAIDLPKSPFEMPISATLYRSGISLSEDEIRLVVWLITDGHIAQRPDRKSRSIRWHLKKERKIVRLTELLTRLDVKYSVNKQKSGTTKINISVYTPYHSKLLEWCYINNEKKLPIFLRNISFSQFNIFIQEYGNTDGSFGKNNDIIQICTHKKEEADLIQEICHTNSSSCKVLPKKGNPKYHLMYINLKRTDTQLLRSRSVFREPFIGNVVCFSVNNGTLMVRRNGVVSISGNSQLELGRIWYTGNPRWLTKSCANKKKGIWLCTHNDSGKIIEKQFISTESVCTPIISIVWKEGEAKPEIPTNAKVDIELVGSSDWITKEKLSLKGVSVSSKITDSKRNKERKSGSNLRDFILNHYKADTEKRTRILKYLGELNFV